MPPGWYVISRKSTCLCGIRPSSSQVTPGVEREHLAVRRRDHRPDVRPVGRTTRSSVVAAAAPPSAAPRTATPRRRSLPCVHADRASSAAGSSAEAASTSSGRCAARRGSPNRSSIEMPSAVVIAYSVLTDGLALLGLDLGDQARRDPDVARQPAHADAAPRRARRAAARRSAGTTSMPLLASWCSIVNVLQPGQYECA